MNGLILTMVTYPLKDTDTCLFQGDPMVDMINQHSFY